MTWNRLFVLGLILALGLSVISCSKMDAAERPGATIVKKAQVANEEAEIRATLTEIVALLEKGDAKAMMDKFYAPEALERMKSAGYYDRAAESMTTGPRAERMIQRYKDAMAQTPEWNADKTEATFQPTEEGRPPLRLRKQDGRWYLSMLRRQGAPGAASPGQQQ